MSTNVLPINLGFVNAYLLKAGEEYVLIDTGLAGQWDALNEGLKSRGCYPGLLKAVILTHGDPDHSGNCSRLKQTYRAPIAVHPLDSGALERGERPQRTVRTLSARIAFGLLGVLRSLRRRKPVAPEHCTPDVLLENGQSLAEYGLAATVYHLPGHTKGSVGIVTDEGDFFAGDLFTNRRRPALSPFVECFDEYRQSIEKVKELAGRIKTVYPGHGSSFTADRLAALSL